MKKIHLYLSLILIIILSINLSVFAQKADKLTPFVLPWDDNSENITNMSRFIEKPAGKYGVIKIKNGHLYSGDNRIRFFGTNLARGAVFPSHSDAEKISAHLARLGINCVRFHYIDALVSPNGIFMKDKITLDPSQLEKMDYFIYQLKNQGIYIDLNLHVGRTYPQMPTWSKMPVYFKGIDIFYQPMIEMQKEYIKMLLTHYNPYTKSTYANEPAIAFVEINNENSLIYKWDNGVIASSSTPDIYKNDLKKQWNDWLNNKYKISLKEALALYGLESEDKFSSVEIFQKSQLKDINPIIKQDWLDFLYFTENNYWLSMYKYIKEDLKSNNLIIGTQNCFSPYSIQNNMDIIDNHMYWQHPTFPNKPWDPNDWKVKNISMAGVPDGGTISKLAQSRIIDKPFFVTEYNHPAPNTHASEAFLLLSAYAGLQDWDGIFSYEYNNSASWDLKKIRGFFQIDQHPTQLVNLIPASCLFKRADVKTSDEKKIFYADYKKISNLTYKLACNVGANRLGCKPELALKYPIGLSLKPQEKISSENISENNKIESVTKELLWDMTPNQGVVTIDTSMTKAVIGSTEKKNFVLNDVNINFKKNMQNWATLSLTKLGESGFNSKGNILIVATGYCENTNMGWTDETKTSVGNNWGDAPSLIEGITADIILPIIPDKVQAWVLDERGNRKMKLKIMPNKDKTIIHIGPEYETLWYEVEIN